MSFRSDVWLCAQEIYRDLAGAKAQWRFTELIALCEKHGGAPLLDPAMPVRQFACWDGEDILLSPYGTPSLYREAIPHELVHRLADTPRWSYLNDCIEGWRYDRAAFVEAVAHKVGKMFRGASE